MTTVTVTTSSRLHFGLYALEQSARAFGGVGMMVAEPALELTCTPSEELVTKGPLSERVRRFAIRASNALEVPPRWQITLRRAPPEHAGLGLGTQLGLSVAAAICQAAKGQSADTPVLAAMVGRGRRSSVGLHGFQHGGWILDGGHRDPAQVGQLENRFSVPEDWRVLLITPPNDAGLSGSAEAAAFATLPAIPAETTDQLRQLAIAEMHPSLMAGDFARFSAAVGSYGRAAGECFASVQGGPFASPAIASMIAKLNALGVKGCGQSSWGPTVFALCDSQHAAEQLSAELRACSTCQGSQIVITRPNNHGACVQR